MSHIGLILGEQPRGLLGIIEFGGATRFFPENVINVSEGFFEHERYECAPKIYQRQSSRLRAKANKKARTVSRSRLN
jgi:hypothetical protein